jgi:hypothetical protein
MTWKRGKSVNSKRIDQDPEHTFEGILEAEKARDSLANGDSEGWDYRIQRAGLGRLLYYRIAVYDEKGEFVGYW